MGTLTEKDLGIFRAQQLYFSSFVLWLGFVPTPGGYTTMGTLFINLLAKLIFKSTWKAPKTGIYITHLGALLLLGGGFLTAAFSTEGFMVIPQGKALNFVSDYHKIEFAVSDSSSANLESTVIFPEEAITPGKTLRSQRIPFQIDILQVIKNVRITKRTTGSDQNNFHGFASLFEIQPGEEETEAERNHAGIVFKVSGTDSEKDGVYNIFDGMEITQTIRSKNKVFLVEIRRKRTYLPLAVELLSFAKENYPGTSVAKNYKSIVSLIDHSVSQRAVIQLNEPVRTRGYTFYQSSYSERADGVATVLAVVKNTGWIFPYVSSIIMCFGLLVHLLIQIPKLLPKTSQP